MRQQVASFDWAANPLGPQEGWCPELRTVVEQVLDSGFPKAVCWGPSLITIHNDAFRPILGDKPNALGRPFYDVWAEAWDEIGPIANKAKRGESTFISDFPLTINRSGEPEDCHFTFCYSPLRLNDGSVGGMLDTVVETTATVAARANLEVANKELAHRLKNTLAIVQAVASQTLRRQCEPDAYTSFSKRLQALAHAHDVLLAQNWAQGSFRETIRDALGPTVSPERLHLTGPDFPIGSRTTMTLSMMLHELGSNAAKYGAMTTGDGTIAIEWTLENDQLVLHWVEAGGPEVAPPSQTGFGSRLIAMGLGGGSSANISFPPEGMEMKLTAPMTDLAH